MTTFLLLILAFGPSLLWMYWLWTRDKFQQEPVGLVAFLMLGGGFFSVCLTLATVPLYANRVPSLQESASMHMLLTAALPEEAFKMLQVLLFAWRAKSWNEPFDGIVYAGATALGFHLVETSFYMFSSLEEGLSAAVYQGLIRGIKPGHMLYGVAMGFFLSQAKFSRTLLARLEYLALALIVPVLLHTAWNTANAWGGNFVGAENLGGLFSSLLAWGLSVALWVTAYELMRQNQAKSPYHPDGWSLTMSPHPCGRCGDRNPAVATYCNACGVRLK